MRRVKVIVTSEFHNRETYVFAYGGKKLFINKRQYFRMWKKVCGIYGCKCSIDAVDSNGNSYVFACVPRFMVNTDTYELVLENKNE